MRAKASTAEVTRRVDGSGRLADPAGVPTKKRVGNGQRKASIFIIDRYSKTSWLCLPGKK